MQYAAGTLKRLERESNKIHAATFVGLVVTLRVRQSRRRGVTGLKARAKFEYRARLPRLDCSELLVNRTKMSRSRPGFTLAAGQAYRAQEPGRDAVAAAHNSPSRG